MKKQLLKKLCVAAIGIMGVSSAVNAQNHWLATVSGTTAEFSGDYKGNHLAIDASGNTYTTGTYRASTSAANTTSAYSHGQTGTSGAASFSVDIAKANSGVTKDNSFITKTNVNGGIEWMLGFGSTAATAVNTITNTIAVNSNAVYVGGNFNGTINYVSPSFTGAPTNIATTSGIDGLVFKLSTDGTYLSHIIFGGTGTQSVTAVTTDSDGNLLVIGTYATELTINGTSVLTTVVGGTDVFVAKFNAAGTLLFVTSIGGTGADAAVALAADVDNAIYVSGGFFGNMIVKPDNAATVDIDESISLAGTGTNSYLVKFDASLNAIWAKSINSTGTNLGYGLAVDYETTVGNRGVYLTGYATNSAVAPALPPDVDFAGVAVSLNNGSINNPYVAKFNAATGNGVWAKIFKAESNCFGYLMAVNPNKEIFAAGFSKNINIDGTDIITTGNDDGFILKMNPDNGTVLEIKSVATVGTDRVAGLAVTNSAIYANGIAGGASANSTTTNFSNTGADFYYRGGSWDIFIMKWNSTTLPVTLTDFKGNKTTSGNQLSWNTLSESNNKHFEVQRSGDGINFSVIQAVNTKAVSGNSTAKLSYSYTDANPLAGVNYYRLKQVDNDGKFSYSENVIAINNSLSENNEIKVYPNPGSGNITIQFSTESVGREVNVYNQAGQLVKSFADVSGNSHVIDITAQPSGIYFIQVLEKGKSNLIKYIKQ